MKLMYPSRQREARKVHLSVKVELLRKSVEEIQKFELLTTNQYLRQMELVLEILQDISRKTQGSEST